MKICNFKFGMTDIVRCRKNYCQVLDIIASKDSPYWLYDLVVVGGDKNGTKLNRIEERKIRELTEKQAEKYLSMMGEEHKKVFYKSILVAE